MRWSRTIPYPDTKALQTNTATKPRKTLVAMESRIDLHSSLHAPAYAFSRRAAGRRLRWRRLAGPRLGDGAGPALGGTGRAGSRAAGCGIVGGSRTCCHLRTFRRNFAGLRIAAQSEWRV